MKNDLYPKSTNISFYADLPVYKITATKILFLSRPDTNAVVLRYLDGDDRILVEKERDYWSRVNFYNEVGHVSSKFLVADSAR